MDGYSFTLKGLTGYDSSAGNSMNPFRPKSKLHHGVSQNTTLRARMLETLKSGPLIYPFLFAIYPILSLWSNNIEEVSAFGSVGTILLPMLISAGITIPLLAIFRVILGDWRSAGLFVVLILFLFFSYGHVQERIYGYGWTEFAKNRFMVLIGFLILIAGTILLLRFRHKLKSLTNSMNIMSVILIVFTLPNIIGYSPVSVMPSTETEVKSNPARYSSPTEPGTRPDIYYITMESYSSANSLMRDLNYDNTRFIDYLKSKTFFVASESKSNYGRTILSLTSSMNMEYFDSAANAPTRAVDYWSLQNNKAMQFAREHGYRVVYLADRWPAGREELGDTYFGCAATRRAVRTQGFIDALLHSTALHPVLVKFSTLEPGQRDYRVCQFFRLAKSQDITGPKVVVIHLPVPGFPYVVGRDGEPPPGAWRTRLSAQDFLNQLSWTNDMLESLIDALLSDPDYSPVIVLQGDHGEVEWGDVDLSGENLLRRDFEILNAYHLPNGGENLLYPSISPVNTFRTIFNHYLEADFDILEDRYYLETTSPVLKVRSDLADPKNGFVEVTEELNKLSED